ncbi:MAG: DNA-binding protein WhiA [Thermotogota bacterium]
MTLVSTKMEFPEVELYGAIKGKGDFVIDGYRKYIKITVNSLSSMKRIYKLSKLLFGDYISAYVKMERRLKLGRTGEILLDLASVEKIVGRENIDIYSSELPQKIKNDPFLFGVFLKGMFLTTGSVSFKSSYHLEFFLDISEEYADTIVETFYNLIGIKSNYIIKNNKVKLYIKSSRDILNVLEVMDSHDSVDKLNDIIKVRELKGNVTRTINFLTANALKTAESSSQQINDILFIEEKIGLDNLTKNLKKIAEHRLENEDQSLKEMAEDLNMKKSTLYSRIKKIKEIAKDLKDGEKD